MTFAYGLIIAILAQGESVPEVDDFFERFQGERGAVNSFTADFTQRTVTPDETIDATGRIVYARPQRVRFIFDDGSIDFMLDGLRIYEYDSEFEQIQMYDLEDRPETEALFLGFESEPGRLREAYDIELRPRADGEPGLDLELTPKPKEEEEPLFLGVTLELRPNDFLPTAIRIKNDEESSVLYALSNHRVNPELTEDERTIFVPENTVVVENDRYIETAGPEGARFPKSGEREPATTVEDLP